MSLATESQMGPHGSGGMSRLQRFIIIIINSKRGLLVLLLMETTVNDRCILGQFNYRSQRGVGSKTV